MPIPQGRRKRPLSYDDYRLNAQVRALLVRRGIDLAKVEYGVTNSVVYIKGVVRPYFTEDATDPSQARVREMETVARLERTLRAMPGIRDVVFQLDRLVKVGWKWKPR
jgi:hypothetical protein